MKFWKLTYPAISKIERIINDDGDFFESVFENIYDEMREFSYNNLTIFLAAYSPKRMILGACTRNGNISEYLKPIKEYIPDNVSCECKCEEITGNDFNDLITKANNLRYGINDDDIRENTGIARIFSQGFERCIDFSENFAGMPKNIKVYSLSLDEEVGRIKQGCKKEGIFGNPVHYIVGGNSEEIRKSELNILVSNLYESGRTELSRYSEIYLDDFRYNPDWFRDSVKDIYTISKHGTVCINITEPIRDNNERRSRIAEKLEIICEISESFRSNVVSVFLLPDNSEASESHIRNKINKSVLISIREDAINFDEAKKYLSKLSKENQLRADKHLYNGIEEGHSYFVDELEQIYNTWHQKTISRRFFPQYSSFELPDDTKKVSEKEPKGSAYRELMEMIGLEEAKSVINNAVDYFNARKLFIEKGFNDSVPSMHMVFTGSPGTAKTSVARLFSRIMKENGILSTGEMIEVGRADLVGEYVGQTAPKVKAAFRKALGGVLFIDEAYSLLDDRHGMYGDEAINTIVQEMENNREDVIVIFAGYSDRMEEFINNNPGLRSRIAFHVPFADYSPKELCDIAKLMAKSNDFVFGDGVNEKLLAIMETACKNNDFGNGRFVRNVMEQARIKQASRLIHSDTKLITREQMATLIPEDFEILQLSSKKENERKIIGF